MSEYDDAMATKPGPDPDTRTGMFSEGWMIGNAVNGGVVMAAALTALRDAIGADSGAGESVAHPDPVVMSAYFMTAAQPGPVTFRPQVLRRGRQLTTTEVSVVQDTPDGPTERMRALASFGDLSAAETMKQAPAPAIPQPEQCLSSDQAPPDFLKFSKFLDRVDLRLDPATAGWAMGKPSGQGMMRGWLRLRDQREPDTTTLMMALDAMPPVAFDLGLFGWTPTLEFTGHVRRRPEPGWLRVALSTENLGGGMLEEDAMIWDSAGNFVAQSRQLCGVRTDR